MIDPKLFTVESLLAVLLYDQHGNRDAWRKLAEIVPDYLPPYARADTPRKCVVRFGESFLRHSKGPRQGHFWDTYGDDYQYSDLALIALLEAPVPPSIVGQETWDQLRALADPPRSEETGT